MPEQVIILTGEIHSGKTSKLLRWCQGRGDVFGILTPVYEGTRFFRDIHSGEQFRMEADYEEDALVVGRYRFSTIAFNKATHIIQGAIHSKGWLVLDEIGPLELKGEGFAQVVKLILREKKGKILLVVRAACLDKVIQYFSLNREWVKIIVSEDLPGISN